ncbi:MAG: 50S ribosomal protein L13 [Candidatus Brockarchaeota archaeon]|nr:50S ribosomal protein L13 [Candidatus Brockarchaeota archaeon]
MVVDASNLVAGRLSSIVAKNLLEGRRVAVINAEKAVFTGTRRKLEERLEFFEVKSRINPKHTPRHYRRPDTFFRRMVRGMLPRRKPSGAEAMKRLRVYVGVPEAYRGKGATSFKEAEYDTAGRKHMTLGELCAAMGWRGGAGEAEKR